MTDFSYSRPDSIIADSECGTQGHTQDNASRKAGRRSRGRKAPDGEAKITHGTRAGEPVAFIPLFGVDGHGHAAIVDAELAATIVAEHGSAWCLNHNGKGHKYVRKGGVALANAARQKGTRPTATLARIICGAAGRQRVRYRNGNRLDLRRSNLILEGAAKAATKRASLTSA